MVDDSSDGANDVTFSDAVVVGGGVSGLTAARALAQTGRAVLVLEAENRAGGQIRTVELAGRRVELGAEALHLAAPVVRELVDDLGLTDRLRRCGPGGTWLATPNGLRRLPQGVGPTGPTQLMPVVRSGILSLRGMARAAVEPLVARRHTVDGEISVGHFVRARFGDEVADTLVDPMLGGLHSGDIDRLSLAAASPTLARAAQEGTSLTLSVRTRRSGPSTAPSQFATVDGGLETFVDRLADGIELRTGVRALRVGRHGSRYTVATSRGMFHADTVVLAVPATAAASLLAGVVGESTTTALSGVPNASVATFLLAWPTRAALACPAVATGTGIMVPRILGRTLKAATFVSTKWPHLAGGDSYVLRLSAGRAHSSVLHDHPSDDDLLTELLADLRELTGLRGDPQEIVAHRWHDTMPQLEIGHHGRVATARSELRRRAPGVLLVGSCYDGVGITAAVTSARSQVDGHLTGRHRAAPSTPSGTHRH